MLIFLLNKKVFFKYLQMLLKSIVYNTTYILYNKLFSCYHNTGVKLKNITPANFLTNFFYSL